MQGAGDDYKIMTKKYILLFCLHLFVYVILYHIFLTLFWENTSQLALPIIVKNIDRNQICDIFVYGFVEYYLQVVSPGTILFPEYRANIFLSPRYV